MTDKELKTEMQGIRIIKERVRKNPTITIKVSRDTLLVLDTLKSLSNLKTRGDTLNKLVHDTVKSGIDNHKINKSNFNSIMTEYKKQE